MNKILNFIKNHKKLSALGMGFVLYGSEANFGGTSKLISSVTSLMSHSKMKGQYWQAEKQFEGLEAKLKGVKVENNSDSGLFPDTNIFKIWPITTDNKIEVTTREGTQVVVRNPSREYVQYKEIPSNVVNAFIYREDRDYFHHYGINWKGKARAVFYSIFKGKKISGGSGITEQVAKWAFTPENEVVAPGRDFLSKILLEMPYATELDSKIGKEKILEFYLNNAYLGDGVFGVKAAAKDYFDKDLKNLTLPEALFLSVLVKNPGSNPKNGGFKIHYREYRAYVESLHKDKIIDDARYKYCTAESAIKIKQNKREKFIFYDPGIFSVVNSKFKSDYDFDLADLITKESNPGFELKITTTVSDKFQQGLKKAFEKSRELRKYKLEGAGVILDSSGRITALVGRTDYKSWADRNLVVEEQMSLGSSIKPFIYALYYLNGGNSNEVFIDSDSILKNSPSNHDEIDGEPKYEGPITLEYALTHSKNTVAAQVYLKLIEKIGRENLGIEENADLNPRTKNKIREAGFKDFLKYMGLLGFDPKEFSRFGAADYRNIPLGTERATALDLASAYRSLIMGEKETFDGLYFKPVIIQDVSLRGKDHAMKLGDSRLVFDGSEAIEEVRRSLVALASNYVSSKYDVVSFFKTGTPSDKNKRHVWIAGGFDLNDDSYSLALLARTLSGSDKFIPQGVYAANILTPVFGNLVSGVSPLREKSIEPIISPPVEIKLNEIETICSNYNNLNITNMLNGDSDAVQDIADNLRVCTSIYGSSKTPDENKYVMYRFYQGEAERRLYDLEMETDGETLAAKTHLKKAIECYNEVLKSDQNTDYLDNTKKRLLELNSKSED